MLLWIVPLAAIYVYYYRRSLSEFPLRQRFYSLLTRCVIALLIVFALCGLTYLQTTDQLFVAFVTDRSASVGEEAGEASEKFTREALKHQGANQAVWLPFDRFPGQVQAASITAESKSETAKEKQEDIPSAPTADNSPHKQATNIAAAIEAAAGFVPTGYVPKIVLLTDGNETIGDALAVASRSAIPIDTIALPSKSDPEVQVASVVVPAEVQEGAPFNVDVTIQSNHDDEGLVEIFRGDHKVLSERRKFKTGSNEFRFQQSIDRDRLAAFSVRVSDLSSDTLLDNNTDSGLVYASGKPRVLIIESDPNLIRELAYALEDEGIQVDVRPPQGMPESLADLQNYECMVLSNVPATDLTTQQMQVARTYVQDLGGGFMMLGGEQSFGLGGYYKSAIEEILPVRSDFEKEKEKPSLGMVLVIDKSGSMDGDKIEMAKSAARAAVELLGRRDMAGVIAFDGDPYVISEMQTAANQTKISDEISTIESGGGTTMYPAMELAFEMLQNAQAKLKHVILLTDGVSSPGDFEGLAQSMVSAKMTVSTVAVGEGSDVTLLESIAQIGKGRFYETSDPTQVPQIFAKETVTASKSAIDEQPFLPQTIRATHALKDIDLENAPFLLGYVMTRPKPTSEVILATEKGDPLLSWWRYGLGMTAAFTSDAKTRWAAEWMTWPGYGKFWTQVVRQIMRKSDTRGVQVALVRENDLASITVDALNEAGQFMNDVQVEMNVIDPSLRQTKTNLTQRVPGQYTSEFSTPHSGAYHVDISVKQNGNIVYRQTRGMMVGYSDELRLKPTNTKLCEEISAASHGSFNPSPEAVFVNDSRFTTRPTALWPWLLTAALCLFVVDVALRRVDLQLQFQRT
jgi:Mg-chelatase subunit ChlD